MQITQSRNAKTLTPSHMKQCILSESRFDFLKDLVKNIPDASTQEDNDNNANDTLEYPQYIKSDDEVQNYDEKQEIVANFYTEQSTSGRTPVIQYSPKITLTNADMTTSTKITASSNSEPKLNITIDNLSNDNIESKIHIDLANYPTTPSVTIPTTATPIDDRNTNDPNKNSSSISTVSPPPPLIPINQNVYNQNSGDNLYIDEDYDN